MNTKPVAAAESADALPPAGRLVSLDVFRGLTILGMLLVNEKDFGPATPSQLTHAAWGAGVHLADLVFPWFLFIVGAALSFASAARQGEPRRVFYVRVLKRTLLLVLLGCLINSSYASRPLFDMGVLQLIGFSYLAAALLYPLPLRARLGLAAALLVGYWAVVRFVPVPGVGAGGFTKSQNIIGYLNATYLSRYSLAGLTSLAPTTALALIATWAGDLLRAESFSPARRVRLLLTSGAALAAAGWLWSFDLEFNKPLWTPSYVTFAAGCALVVLALCYLVIDVKGRRRGAFPLVVLGRNALFAFAAPLLSGLHLLREWTWPGSGGASLTVEEGLKRLLYEHLGRIPGGFTYTFAYILLWWLILFWLYRRGIFLRA